MSANSTFQEAREFVCSTNIFTMHPVPAGNEQFDTELLRRYLNSIGRIGVTFDNLSAWGV